MKKINIDASEIKRNLLKSVVYRIITLIIGTTVAFFLTGDLSVATGIALLTEGVQSVNYFVFESIWHHFERRKLKERLKKEIIEKEVELNVSYNLVRELSYKLSRIDTFNEQVFSSIIKYFNNMLENEKLRPVHDEILKHKSHFLNVHKNRGFAEEVIENEEVITK